MGTDDQTRAWAAAAAATAGVAAVAVAFSTDMGALIAVALGLAAIAWIGVAATPPRATGRTAVTRLVAMTTVAAGLVVVVLALTS